jgi:hypothetical protein
MQVEVVVFGGQKNGYECPHVQEIATTTLAGRTSYRIGITWEETGAFFGDICFLEAAQCVVDGNRIVPQGATLRAHR